ncbi:amino acid adenylation domain-containing protein [Nodularia spumigena]|uniref:amino acid adenylation domain-containing protein n=1 Tax=Nodularia spumigena TaxID=70799 RepID=UPI00232BAC3F|nr:amino acid adenylation domain-containing protein [Nodularia spumigena]MDB9316589.1 amino acid adenylation domain-containing protein [Nodularia spumigena CS-590/01A]MDB9324170.1 amino acid adenylation domain-containing protein [Nodularia spumigena CS-591/07A]MDB9325414.1 amino acid adenylation domain-containing protein [Nodularia spumigena CS-590/02]MDB9331670.1 amino acid adenylation domain-containing protein [Nodularia spumigena CS-591/04]MDB9335970.1 amino acid adenylation domain-containi
MHPVDKRQNIENIYPLSPMQQGMLFHTLLTPQVGLYVPQVCLYLEGRLNINALQTAWNQVLENHAALRTAFYWEQRDKPFQVVFRQVEIPWKLLDWQGISEAEIKVELEEYLQGDRILGFDIKQPPLMRFTLIQLSDIKYILIWTQHHLILDGWSSALVIKQVWQNYYNSPFYYPNSRPYSDYIAWLQQQDKIAAKQFWQKQLQGFTTPSYPLSFLRSESNNFTPQEQHRNLTPSQTTCLQQWAKQQQLTLNTLLQAAFAILLSRYCHTTDVVFGATSSGRPTALPGVESMVGLFINTLPVRVQVSATENLVAWLQKLQAQQAEALDYEYTSLLEIQKWSQLSQGTSLFDSILVFENYPVDTSAIPENQELRIVDIQSLEWTSFPLTVLVSVGNQLSLKVKYDRNRFTDHTITQLLEHFCTLLLGMSQPVQTVGNLPLLTQQEYESIQQWNQTEAYYPLESIHQQFVAQVERTPDNIAVVFEDKQLTYKELNQRANQLAHYLQTLGVQPEIPVGIYIERSLEMVIGILGILKAGGCYLPLDPAYTVSRLTYIIDATNISVLLTQSSLLDKLPNYDGKILALDTDLQEISQTSENNPTTLVNPDNAIYIIYTSGSTGTPKGVINNHRGVSNRLYWMQQQYNLEIGEPVLQKTPFSFDVSVWEFFWTLLNGGCLVMAKPEGHQDTNYLLEIIEQQQITTLHFVPTMLGVFLEEPNLTERCRSVKRVICSGEALSIEIQNRFFRSFNAELHNLYGPTEAAIDVTYWQCQPTPPNLPLVRGGAESGGMELHTVPIGRPISNTQIYLLNDYLQPVPLGVPGEIYIGGVGVARGYWNRPDLTAERFITNAPHPNPPLVKGRELDFPVSPLSPTPLYKTGDLGRYLPDGNVEYLGRLDNQVKIRGLRIELGEIEAVLNQHPDIQQTVVILDSKYPENQRLVAYVVPASTSTESESFTQELQKFLLSQLPEYMLPSVFLVLSALPLLPNGKINRQALPQPETVRHGNQTYIAPRNSTETLVANILADVLRLERMGVDENFFELGGNSLLAIRVTSRLREAFQLDLPLHSVFEKPTIAGLAEGIEILQQTIQQMQTTPSDQPGRKEISL